MAPKKAATHDDGTLFLK